MSTNASAFTVMSLLLDALKKELARDGTLESLCHVSIQPGADVPLDYGMAECGGMAWVRLTSAFPSQQFPVPANGLNSCAYELAYPLEVGVIRPAPPVETTHTNDIILPTEEAQLVAVQGQLDDMQAVHRAVAALAGRLELVTLGNYTPMGPMGDIVGGIWTLTAGGEED